MSEKFSCSVYDLLHRHGFMEGDFLIPEEKPLVEQACQYLANELSIIENRWKPEIIGGRYMIFLDLTTNQAISFYDMTEIDRRKISAVIDKKELNRIQMTIDV